MKTMRPYTVLSLEMRYYRYFVNLRRSEMWSRARMARFGDIRNLQTLRSAGPSWHVAHSTVLQTARRWKRMVCGLKRPRRWMIARDAGWHFSSLSGPAAVLEKFRAYAHIHGHLDDVDAVAELMNRTLAVAFDGSNPSAFRIEALDDQFPAYLLANRARFAHLIAEPPAAQQSAQAQTRYEDQEIG